MFTFNFKKRFAGDVESGRKRQTIRAKRKDGRRPAPGEIVRCYTGMRTASCRRLGDFTCSAVESIQIYDDGERVAIVVDGQRLSFADVVALAKADGLRNREDLIEFFRDTHGLPFEGFVTQWTIPEARP